MLDDTEVDVDSQCVRARLKLNNTGHDARMNPPGAFGNTTVATQVGGPIQRTLSLEEREKNAREV